MKHLFIVNPTAGKQDATEAVAAKVAMAMANRRNEEYEIYITKASKDAVVKIRREAKGERDLRVYACGGDGTLNECVTAAVGLSNVSVTHLPYGTGNDFVRMFRDDRERFDDLNELLDGEIRPIDIVKCNDYYSLNICSVGMDARIGAGVHKYDKIPLLGGFGAYVVSTIAEFFKGIPMPLRIECGGRVFEGEFSLACACNGSYYGGGFNPVPTARPDDGVLDILVIKAVSRLTFLRVVGIYAKGDSRKLPQYITHIRSDSMIIDSKEPILLGMDGEAIYSDHIEMRVIPGGVNFIFPRNMKYFSEIEYNEPAIASK